MHWLFETARYYLHTYGYWAVLFVLLGENAGLPLPGETILILASFAAYHGHSHHLKIQWVILVAICACTLGDNLGYWIGRRGGRPLLEKYKSLFRIKDETIRAGEEYLQRRGFFAIFIARFIAGIRIVAGPLAGVLRMEWKRFLVANFAGAVVWVTAISSTGYFFGSQFRTFARIMKQTEAAILVALLVFALYLLRRKKNASGKRKQGAPSVEPADRESRKIEGMKAQVKRVVMLVVGWAFILLGIAGLFLPVLQGILFLLIGLFILSSEYVWAHHLLHKLKERFPKIAVHFEHAKQRAESWMGRAFHHKTAPKPKQPGAETES